MKLTRRAVILLGKYPKSGNVKTRLQKDIGSDNAVTFYKYSLTKIINELGKLKGFAKSFFFYGDKHSQEKIENWVGEKLECVSPNFKQINKHLEWAFKQTFKKGFSQVISVASDVPALDADIIKKAFLTLDQVDVVIGPDNDGGIYLFGCKQNLPFLFIGFSNDKTLQEDVIDKLRQKNLVYRLLPVLIDVDTFADYQKWKANI